MPEEHKPLRGKTCVITGANTGIGRATAHELAARGAHVILACRNVEKGQEAVDAIRRDTGNEEVEPLALDLASFDSVRSAAKTLLSRDIRIPLLINNAGLAGQRGLTKDGFEIHFGTNHLGHFLFTKLLLDRIEESGPARIVHVASKAHYDAKALDFSVVRESTKTITGVPEYSVSKLANVLYSAELARRLAGTDVCSYSLHPGVVASDAWRRIPWPIRWFVTRGMISNEEGAKTSVYCATSPEVAGESGYYYDRCRKKEPSKLAQDEKLAAELWERSEAWVAG